MDHPAGFQVNWMNLRDGDTGQTLWSESNWDDIHTKEKKAIIPKSILQCRTVSREVNFTSTQLMQNFRIVQTVKLNNQPIEEWLFTFGFVIPNSTNTWQNTIDANPDGMLPPEILSGNTVIETEFFDGELGVSKSSVRLYYE
ncbi:retinal rod rhodopsin-sensitive cGMP 3',5'-cyclic phosphodiesterase subunit delta-like protein [Chytridium lagenaria]|nr:retinal rod rhodopsin-sensitive cGMP 3',5'-cyclic phosphodiesterase subunit delta-like protein [Chytridium lagenaria]